VRSNGRRRGNDHSSGGRIDSFEVRLKLKKADPLMIFAGSADDMNGAKPHGYDPFVMASVSRMDVKLTILARKP